jgi:ABC-type sugar transport system permease subunit
MGAAGIRLMARDNSKMIPRPSGFAPSESVSRRLRRFFGPDARTGWLFLVPLIVLVLGLLVYPVVQAFLLSLQDKRAGIPSRFVGLDNYVRLLTSDPAFRRVIVNSLVYTAGALAGKSVLGLILALVLNERIVLRNVWRGFILIPWAMPSVVMAIVMTWMFGTDLGVTNYVLKGLGLIHNPIQWLSVSRMALVTVILVNIWRGFPFFGLNYLAGLQAIPADLYEAASIDGASAWQRFYYITLPGLRFVMLITTLLSMIWTFNDFDIVYLITGGGPHGTTDIFGTFAYQMGFRVGRLGLAAASSIIVMPLEILIIMSLLPRMFKEAE